MDQRLRLHNILSGFSGVKGAYYQPSSNVSMQYPAIVYQRDNSFILNADNNKYWRKKKYTVIVIDRNPDSLIPDMVENMPYARFDRFYVIDGLNHFVFNLYF